MTIGRVAARLRALLRKRDLDRELDGEILAHLEMAERDAIAAGLSPEEARAAARRSFGGIEQMREEHRDRRSFLWIENLWRDFRGGLEALTRDPGFSAVVIGVLALGIGANVAVFSMVDAVLLKPLPFPEPDRIVRVWEAARPGVTNATSTLDFLDWKRLGTVFETLSAEIPISAALTGGGEPLRLSGRAVTADYFRVYGTDTSIGRTFAQQEDQPGTAPIIVLSHATWQTYFGGDRNILDRRAILDGEPHQIIGVLPPGAFDRYRTQFWKPLVFTPDQHLRESHWLMVQGRLRKGVTLEQAREKMAAIDAALEEVTPVWKRDWTIVVEPLSRLLIGDKLRQSIAIMFGAVVLVLLIACANVTNLLLAKGAARKKEMAIRTALGASRGRLMAQLLTEGLALCLLGGAAGLALAWLLVETASPILSQFVPYTASLAVDFRVFAFAAAVALGVGLLVGAFPALQTSAGNVEQALRQTARGSSAAHHNVRRSIVVAEVALSLVLVCGALLLFKSLFRLQQLETGIRIENVITMSINLPTQVYPAPAKAASFYESLGEKLKAIPGVTQAGLSTHLPLRWITNGEGVEVGGVPAPINVRFKRVDPGYFDTLGIPLLAGRGITDRDRLGARRVVVVNEALAGRLAEAVGMKNPVGHVVRLYCPRYVEKGTVTEEVEIIGIIRSERVARPGIPDPAVVYVPMAQVPSGEIKLIVRTQTEPLSVISGIRDAVRQIDANLPIGEIETMQEVRDSSLSGASRPTWLIGIFAALAAFLAAIGLYGVLSQMVLQRRREIGIRMALGARPGDVVSHVLRNATILVVVGLCFGMLGTLALTKVMESLLFEVSPLDPVALAVACSSMMAIGLFAGLIPANRAARVDPVTTLRDEG